MSTKTFCDSCGDEMVAANTPLSMLNHNAAFSAGIATPLRGKGKIAFFARPMAAPAPPLTDVCTLCIADAMTVLVTKAPSA